MAQLMTNHSLWQVVDVKVRGSSHERTGLPCQDAYKWDWIQEGKSLIVAVSDGAGSAKFSDKGSQLATEKVVTHLLHNPALSHLTEESQWRQLVTEAAQEALNTLQELAKQENHSLREYACTLLIVAITPEWIAGFQIGDGAIVLQAPDEPPHTLFPAEKGEYLNETIFLTSQNSLNHAKTAFKKGIYKYIACFTDGISLLALQMPQEIPHEPFFKPLFAYVDSEEASPEEKRQELTQFFTSEKIRRRTDDDITLILISRQKDTPTLQSAQNGLIELGQLLSKTSKAALYEVKNLPTLSALLLDDTPDTSAALHQLLSHRPSLPKGFEIQVPVDVIKRDSTIVGYLLAKPPSEYHPLDGIANASKRIKNFGSYTFDYAKIIDMALRLVEGGLELHRQGWWIGPLSEERLWFGPESLLLTHPMLLQLREKPNVVSREDFYLLYLRPEHLSSHTPKNADKTFLYEEQDEVHGIFTAVFRLLMNGHFPYKAEPAKGRAFLSHEELTRRRIFAYDAEVRRIFGYHPPKDSFSLDILPTRLQKLFIQAFSPSKHHSLPSLSQLREALLEMRGNLQTCRRFPTHVYPSHLSKCPWCERRLLWGFDPFPGPALPSLPEREKPVKTGPPQKKTAKSLFRKLSISSQREEAKPVEVSSSNALPAATSPSPTPSSFPATSETPSTQPARPQFRPSKWLWIGLLVALLIGLLVWFSRYL
jgi:hypothetical protein